MSMTLTSRASLRPPHSSCTGCCVSRALSGPVFVMEWLFDEVQLMVFNATLMGQPFLQGEWNYLQSLGKEIKSTLLHVS